MDASTAILCTGLIGTSATIAAVSVALILRRPRPSAAELATALAVHETHLAPSSEAISALVTELRGVPTVRTLELRLALVERELQAMKGLPHRSESQSLDASATSSDASQARPCTGRAA